MASKAADVVSEDKNKELKVAREAEQAAKVVEVHANKAVLDEKIVLHTAAVANYRQDTLKQADTHVSQTTLNAEKQMDQFADSAKAVEGKQKVAEALEVVKVEEKKTQDFADAAGVKLEKPKVPEETVTVDRDGFPITLKTKDIPSKDQIEFKHARIGGKGFAVGPSWLNR